MELGWTKEDQEIWRKRKMKPHTIKYRFKHHLRECDIMSRMSRMTDLTPAVKILAVQFEMKIGYWQYA